MLTAFAEYAPVFLSTHVVHGHFRSPMDHSYVAFDANIHPFHSYDDHSNPGAEKYLYPVENKCFLGNMGTIDGANGQFAKFCGMLPWQEGDNVCNWNTISTANSDFKALLTADGYVPADNADEITNLLQAKGLIVGGDAIAKHTTLSTDPHFRHKSQQICQYESYNGAQVVLNEDSAYSLNSAHSVWVLWVSVWSIVFMSFAMSLKNAYFRHRQHRTGLTRHFFTDKQWPIIIDYLALVFVLSFYFSGIMWYGYNMPRDRALIWPNGSFAYSFIAIVYSWLFLRKSTALHLNTNFTSPFSLSDRRMQSTSDDNDDSATKPLKSLEPLKSLDMSNFSAKIKSDGFMQAGKGGRNVLTAPLKDDIKELGFSDYQNVETNCSHFQSTQLWVLPFVTLIAHIYDKNFDIDINVTVVFVLTMLFCILDVFGKKVTQLHEIILGFEETPTYEKAGILWNALNPSSLLLVVHVVNFILQFSIFLYLYYFFQVYDRDGSVLFVNWGTYLVVYFAFNALFKIVRILASVFRTPADPNNTHTRGLFHWLLKNHVYENACMFVLLLILLVYWANMYQDDALYEKPKDCPDDLSTSVSCKMMMKWGKNYDFNTGAFIEALVY